MSQKLHDFLWRSLIVICATAMALAMVGCGHKPSPMVDSKPTMPEIVRAATEAGESIAYDVERLNKMIDELTPANVETSKPVMLEVSTRIGSQWGKVKVKLESLPPVIEKQAKETAKLEKEVAALKAEDPVKAWFNLIGWMSVAGGIAAVIAGVWLGRTSVYSLGGCAALFGLCLITIAWYIAEIRFVIGLGIAAAVLSGVVYIINNRKALADKARSRQPHGAAQASTSTPPAPAVFVSASGVASPKNEITGGD
jgi:hypothetical protein